MMNVCMYVNERMLQIIVKIKDDLSVDLLLVMFRGTQYGMNFPRQVWMAGFLKSYLYNSVRETFHSAIQTVELCRIFDAEPSLNVEVRQ